MLVAQAGITKINLILIYIEYVYIYFFNYGQKSK